MTYVITEPCIDTKDASCVDVCPVGAIAGERKAPHIIDGERCTRCGACKNVCPTEAVLVE